MLLEHLAMATGLLSNLQSGAGLLSAHASQLSGDAAMRIQQARDNAATYVKQMDFAAIKQQAGAGARGFINEKSTWLANQAKASGVNDYAQWASAQAFEIGSGAHRAAMKVTMERVAAEHGEEVFDMLQALHLCTANLSNEVGLAEMKFGVLLALPLLQHHHNELEPPATRGEVKDVKFCAEAGYWLDYAASAYGTAAKISDDKANVRQALSEAGKPDIEVLLASLPAKGVQSPGHFVAIDKAKKCVVLGVRGTTTISDAITDAVGESYDISECPGLQAHKAMLASARTILQRVRIILQEALSSNRGFELIVTGHSLGAGTACLCSILLKAQPLTPAPKSLRCFAFAPPPVVSDVNASAVRAVQIHSFINRTDVVPRAGLSNVVRLFQECKSVDDLELNFMQRLNLVQPGVMLGSAELEFQTQRQKVVDKIKHMRANYRPHQKFPPLFVPGTVYWIEWPDRPGNVQDQEEDGVIHHAVSKLHYTDCKEFQDIRLRGGANAVKDHLCSGYAEGLKGALKHAQQQNGCAVCAGCRIM